jgi:hypothetical protein
MRSDSLKNVRTWTSRAIWIRKLLEQTAAECIKNALLIDNRISLYVQGSLTFYFPSEYTSSLPQPAFLALAPLINLTIR